MPEKVEATRSEHKYYLFCTQIEVYMYGLVLCPLLRESEKWAPNEQDCTLAKVCIRANLRSDVLSQQGWLAARKYRSLLMIPTLWAKTKFSATVETCRHAFVVTSANSPSGTVIARIVPCAETSTLSFRAPKSRLTIRLPGTWPPLCICGEPKLRNGAFARRAGYCLGTGPARIQMELPLH